MSHEASRKAKLGEGYCTDCDTPVQVRLDNGDAPLYCPDCRAKWCERVVIYDRDRHIGQLPANLKERYSL